MTVPAPRSPGAVKCLSSGPFLCQRLDFAACQAPAAPPHPLHASTVLQTHKEVCEWSEGSGEGGNILRVSTAALGHGKSTFFSQGSEAAGCLMSSEHPNVFTKLGIAC